MKVKYFIPIINAFDYQDRIIKNIPEIIWKNKVHEQITGYKTYLELPAQEEYCIIHIKEIDKQEKQNNFYTTL